MRSLPIRITDFIEADSSLPTRRSALASLSRSNRTFHNIATSKLYLHVVLTNEKRVGQWGKFYASKVNPWNLKDAKDELKDVVVPTSVSKSGLRAIRDGLANSRNSYSQITFIPLQDNDLNPPTQQIFPRERPSFDPLLAVSTPLTSFFFRNVTSFVVSNGFTLDPKIVATIFAPTQSLRSNVHHLDFSGQGLDAALTFILGAFVQFEYELDWFQFDWESHKQREEDRLDYWERYCALDSVEDPREKEPEWLWDDDSTKAQERKLVSRASFDFDCFNKLFSFIIDPNGLPSVQNFPSAFAFSKLESLTLVDPNDTLIGLMFIQALCYPSLVRLKLVGEYDANEDGPYWVPFWRLAITK